MVKSLSWYLKESFACDPGHGVFVKAQIDAMNLLLMVKLDTGLPSCIVRGATWSPITTVNGNMVHLLYVRHTSR